LGSPLYFKKLGAYRWRTLWSLVGFVPISFLLIGISIGFDKKNERRAPIESNAAEQSSTSQSKKSLDDYAAANAAYQDGDYATAIKLFRLLADQGNAAAQLSLGIIYTRGQGVSPDLGIAQTWFSRAAGNPSADSTTLGDAIHNRNLIAKQLTPAPDPPTNDCSKEEYFYSAACLPKAIIPFDPNPMINAKISRDVIDALVKLVKAYRFRCDTISSLWGSMNSSQYLMSCNNNRYVYEITDKGGNWTVTVN
jgi:TPR repeat protein